MTQISEADLSYAAGFFDGEGCIDIRYRQTHGGKYERFELRVHVPQISRGVLEWMAEKFGGSVDKYGGGTCARWHANGPVAADFLRAVLPHLKVKAPQAEVAIQFDKTFPEKRASKGGAGFEKVSQDVRQVRLNCFLKLRDIRKEANVRPSGNRNPLSSERAIQGLSRTRAEVGDYRGPSPSGKDGGLH